MASQTNRDGSVELPDTPTTTSEITTRSTVNGNTIPSRGSATSNRQPTPITSSPSTGVTPSQAPKSAGAIAGGVLGGIFALAIVTAFVFLLLKRRNKKLKYGNYGLTPFHDITAPNLARTDINLKERNRQVLGEQLVPQRYPDNDQTDDIGLNRPGDDTIQVLRHQVYVVTQRMVALEAGLAPPDYNSHL
ncbi:hypothetical protein E1B28_013099 [Marasmius oreades]|uniref:Uncharacterized protein n=1 Tax=Marasmius oreades TaxID=181124 RepID=A0A9P7RQA3_9AGAR|nr:uncharacterized protein E1B28_013099 [Marasmius oreades]KAG7087118.1 hypothetical protein E1B28_013099 [Marasmius oreades]